MKQVLIYGDSNVWGDNFLLGKRIPSEYQWVNILRKKFREKYVFYQEGLPGRVAGNCDKEKVYKNGRDTFMAIYRTNAPVDILIIALGTNDLQVKYNESSEHIIESLFWYKNIINELYSDEEDRTKYFVDGRLPRIIYVLPPNFRYSKDNLIFNKESEKKRKDIISYFEKNKNLEFIVLNNMPLFEDGVHFDYEGHKKMATTIERILERDE